MEQSKLSVWLKSVIIGVGICGLIVYSLVIPSLGSSIVYSYPEFSHCYIPWIIFTVITSVPCFVALVFAWKISNEIGKDNSFSYKNAKYLKNISNLAIADVVIFFVGNTIFLLLNLSHPAVLLASLIVDFVGIAVAVAMAALSHLVLKSAKMREENEGII
ncbi:MAG: DUF2975 domain-containing protein [Clostridia bacterium]